MLVHLVNLTPHTIKIVRDGLPDLIIEPSGHVARRTIKEEVVGEVGGVPFVLRSLGDVEGIPEPREGTIFIVSSLVLDGVTRTDVVAPDTGPTAIREDGQVVAVTRLIRSTPQKTSPTTVLKSLYLDIERRSQHAMDELDEAKALCDQLDREVSQLAYAGAAIRSLARYLGDRALMDLTHGDTKEEDHDTTEA